MKYNLCKNSISLVSQKNGPTSRQIKTPGKTVESKTKDSPTPALQNVDKHGKEEHREEDEKSKDDTEEVDVVCDSSDKEESEIATNSIVDSENADKNEPKSLPRPSAFSPVTPAGAEKSPVIQPDDQKTSTLHQSSFPWSTITPPAVPIKPYPPPMVPDYPHYLLPDQGLYPPYYHTTNHHRNEGNSSFRPEFLDPQRPVVPQPVAPAYPSLFPPYSYRYCPTLHPAAPLPYSLYRPHELSMPITGPRYLTLDMYSNNLGSKDYDYYLQGRAPQSTSTVEENNHGQRSDKATRLSPKEGCSALGSPDRPCNTNNIQTDAERSHYTAQGGHTPDVPQPSRPDALTESSAEILMQMRRQHMDKGLAERKQHLSDSECRDEAAPLNLSTKSLNRDTESPHRMGHGRVENSSREELPLNLSIRPSHVNPSSTSKMLQQAPDVKMDNEEICDQRQTAALALCQLASASSVTSVCEISVDDRAMEESSGRNKYIQASTNIKTTTKIKTLKRKNKGKLQNDKQKPTKKAKTTARALKKRLRCC